MQYTVSPGDTLQSIADQYCQGDDPRQVAEFREGIRELNYDVIGESDIILQKEKLESFFVNSI